MRRDFVGFLVAKAAWLGRKHTEQQHLDLVSLHHLVALELVLDLLVTGLALLLLCAHSATHRDGSLALLRNGEKELLKLIK